MVDKDGHASWLQRPRETPQEPLTPDPRAFGYEPRIKSTGALQRGGRRVVISDEDVLREAKRLGMHGQISAHELAQLRLKLAGQPYRPSLAEVAESAGATMRHARLRGWR